MPQLGPLIPRVAVNVDLNNGAAAWTIPLARPRPQAQPQSQLQAAMVTDTLSSQMNQKRSSSPLALSTFRLYRVSDDKVEWIPTVEIQEKARRRVRQCVRNLKNVKKKRNIPRDGPSATV